MTRSQLKWGKVNYINSLITVTSTHHINPRHWGCILQVCLQYDTITGQATGITSYRFRVASFPFSRPHIQALWIKSPPWSQDVNPEEDRERLSSYVQHLLQSYAASLFFTKQHTQYSARINSVPDNCSVVITSLGRRPSCTWFIFLHTASH